jgi:hypothetical protein
MRPALRAAAAALIVCLLCTGISAQQPKTAPEPSSGPANPYRDYDETPAGSLFDQSVLRDLPLADSVYALLETTQPEVIADRFNSGGLNVGGNARVGAFLASWSQTLFRVGDLDISDPAGTGSALLFPQAMFWNTVRVNTAGMAPDAGAPGLAVTLEPMRPTPHWTGTVTGVGSGGGLNADAPGGQPPPIARLRDYGYGAAQASGPLSDRVGLAAAASWSGSSRLDRERLPATRSNLVSGQAQVAYRHSATDELRTLAWVQHAETPFDQWQLFQDPSASTHDAAVHVQSTWDRAASSPWRVFGGFTQRDRTNDRTSSALTIERIAGGPVPPVIDASADTTTRRFAAGGRLTRPARTRHRLDFGLDFDVSTLATADPFAGTAQEVVDTIPARLWTYAASPVVSHRRSTTIGGFARDTIQLSPAATLEASLRGETIHGRADGAADGVEWWSVLPAATLRWKTSERRDLWLIGSYARRANALRLDWLAYGDPAAPFATIAAAAAPSAIVARVGPGTGGNPAFSAIDPDLGRPVTDEFVVGFERRRPHTRYRLTGIARREGNLLGVVNTGAPQSSYSTIAIPDAGGDLVGAGDDRLLTVYNRLPSSFGQDTYVLTNPDQQAATMFALELAAEHSTGRLFMLFGATASAAEGSGSSRGYGPLENDQDIPGELFTNPNAQTYARGRLFSDRAFTIKWTTRYRMPYGFTVGAIARYQDGQPFARMVVAPGLGQGAEAVQAYPNAGSRFTFTGTLDLRVQKSFVIGGATLDAIFDAYNLFTRSNEVEEYVVTGPAFRTPTAIEPPPAIHLGVRVRFL